VKGIILSGGKLFLQIDKRFENELEKSKITLKMAKEMAGALKKGIE